MRTFLLALSALCVSSPKLADARHSSFHADSADFVVRSCPTGPPASELLKRCRGLRNELTHTWLGEDADCAWRPRCTVVVHASRAYYMRAVGRNGGQTFGSSLIEVKRGQIVTRRIDLLVDTQGRVTALPHELTHVVLADRFRGRQLPRWVDEGIATLADSDRKQKLHHRDCRDAIRNGEALRMLQVLTLDRFTSSRQVPAFYGQSLSLVGFLAERGEASQIIPFVEAALETGYDQALRTYYEIDGVPSLERQWRDYANSRRSLVSVSQRARSTRAREGLH